MKRSRSQIRKLVQELDSYPLAAEQLGLSRQRVHQLAGPGLTTDANIEVRCIDCGEIYRTRKGRKTERCERCRHFIGSHGIPYSPEAAKRVQEEGRRKMAIKRMASHCYLGHPLSGDNLYISPDGRRFCRICKQLRVARYMADPDFRERQREAVRKYQKRNRTEIRERQRHRYATDEEYREQIRERNRNRQRGARH